MTDILQFESPAKSDRTEFAVSDTESTAWFVVLDRETGAIVKCLSHEFEAEFESLKIEQYFDQYHRLFGDETGLCLGVLRQLVGRPYRTIEFRYDDVFPDHQYHLLSLFGCDEEIASPPVAAQP